MLRRNLVPVWIGIILLSGMFLMGQESWGPPPTGMAQIPAGCFDMGDDFYPEGYDKVFSQLSTAEKNAISHRGRALDEIIKQLK